MHNIWLTSDQHFLHRNILKYDSKTRKEKDEYHMGEVMIKTWNSFVQPNDTVYHLGDLFCSIQNRWDYAVDIIKRLNGRIILIKGNHDHSLDFYEKNGIDVIRDGFLIKNHIMLSHYPLQENPYDGRRSRNHKRHLREQFVKHQCVLSIHGHTSNSFNVCCNLWNYEPILALGILD